MKNKARLRNFSRFKETKILNNYIQHNFLHGILDQKRKKDIVGTERDILMEFVLYQCCFPDLGDYAMVRKETTFALWIYTLDV